VEARSYRARYQVVQLKDADDGTEKLVTDARTLKFGRRVERTKQTTQVLERIDRSIKAKANLRLELESQGARAVTHQH